MKNHTITGIMKADKFLFFCLLTGMCASTVFAAAYQDQASIRNAARNFMIEHTRSVYRQQAEIEVGKLDSRLRLRQCSLPLQASMPDGSRELGKLTVHVSCTDAKPWSLYVPVTISIYKQVVVAARTLSRGTLITENDIRLARYDLADLNRGYFEDSSVNLGMRLKRRLLAGDPLTPAMVERPRIIERGQRVKIMAGSGGMVIRTSGKALEPGAVGDRIGVLNVSSKQKLEGVVTEDGEIRVDI
jgi:flagellar basal body P-ring formation protein FlgA